MKLGIVLPYSSADMSLPIDRVLEAERLGFDSVWTSEAYGSDAVTPAAWVLARTTRIKVGTAIMQMPARTPAMTAMTAMTLDALSGGRFILGIGPSGPQVVEGWHGVAYGKPLLRTREYIEIIRKILERNEPLTYAGEHYQIPFAGPGATGLGKPNPQRFELFEPHLNAGFAKSGNQKSLATYDVCPFVPVSMGDDLDEARLPIKQNLALYIGGMGARDKNFYNDAAKRLGYEAAAIRIQDAFLVGRKAEAVAAVPDALVDEIALVGSADRIRDRLQAWKDAGKQRHVDCMLLSGNANTEALRVIAEAVL